ncbi:TAXI family TRAP transporter solute-binding subunit [Desulfosoma sp.]|uniref:TAXI family TRAP transporter solute-binding subunit n=1 Tax=Desulfosoma sp. TaxID=2603217 RepID=UPI0040497464
MQWIARFGWTVGTAALWILTSAAFADSVPLGIVTGTPKGTDYRLGLDLQDILKSQGIDLAVHTSAGSVENIYAVYKRPGVHLAVVQSDVLALLAKVRTHSTLRRMAQKIKLVAPLYNAEVHLLGQHFLRDLGDLEGKRVAVDREDSGTYLTARLLLEISQVKPAEILPMGPEEALDRLRSGTVDAMFYAAGAPVPLFQEKVRPEDHLRLIPVTDKYAKGFYPQTVIPAGTYLWQHENVATISVRAVLVTYDYRMGWCDEVARFAQALEQNLEWLKKNGHPKWKELDLDGKVAGWEPSSCVRKASSLRGLVPDATTEEVNPVVETLRQLFPSNSD